MSVRLIFRLFVCVSVCPQVYISKIVVPISRNILYMLLVTIGRSSSKNNAIGLCYVGPNPGLPDDVMFSHNRPIANGPESETTCYVSSSSPGDATGSDNADYYRKLVFWLQKETRGPMKPLSGWCPKTLLPASLLLVTPLRSTIQSFQTSLWSWGSRS